MKKAPSNKSQAPNDKQNTHSSSGKRPAEPKRSVVDNQISREEELLGDLQRVQAEFINFKNRVELEKAALSQFSKAQVIKDLLPVIDDLERALSHLPKELKDNKWAQGTQKVYDRLQKQLEKLGVSQINALNQPFDPNFHEAVQVEGEGEKQVVSEVMQQGYVVGDQIIRHAIVKVSNS